MPGMFGSFGRRNIDTPPSAPPPLLHRPGTTTLSRWRSDTGFVHHARLEFDELEDQVGVEAGLRCWFCGDLPAHDRAPWDLITAAILDDDRRPLASLHTPFAAAVLDEVGGRAWLISDRRSQYPIFYRVRGAHLDFSTLASAFAGGPDGARFAPQWLYETLYFNYPVMETTFYRDVHRLPPASILSWNRADGKIGIDSYAPPFDRPERFVCGRDALDLAHDVFSKAAADCYRTHQPIAVALTAGFDSRAALAYAPPPGEADLLTFTYGQPGCYDLNEAAAIAKTLGLDHMAITFDETFRETLPRLAESAIRDSDGQERVLRSTLDHVFSTLSGAGRRILVSGVSGDHIFRDHIHGRGNVPALMSSHLMDFIETGDDKLDDPFYRDLLGPDYADFRDHIRGTLDALAGRHGPLGDPAGYARFLVYEIAPKYFGGEAAIARNSLLYRTPYWDSRVVDLAFSLDRGVVGLSTRLPAKDRYVESGLQAHLIGKSLHYGRAPVKGVSAAAYARGRRSLYKLERMLRLGPRKLATLGRRRPVPILEDWKRWICEGPAPLADTLLGADTGISAYVREDSIRKIRQSNDLIRIGQLLSAERVLDLISRNWRTDPSVGAGRAAGATPGSPNPRKTR